MHDEDDTIINKTISTSNTELLTKYALREDSYVGLVQVEYLFQAQFPDIHFNMLMRIWDRWRKFTTPGSWSKAPK
jgi:hypothetical protein